MGEVRGACIETLDRGHRETGAIGDQVHSPPGWRPHDPNMLSFLHLGAQPILVRI